MLEQVTKVTKHDDDLASVEVAILATATHMYIVVVFSQANYTY